MQDWKLHTLNTLQRIGVKPSKKMGQNFLIKYKIVNDIVSLSNLNSEDHVLEIGGGLGMLTHAIYQRTENITIIEKDPILAQYLIEAFPDVKVVLGDALKEDWPKNVKIVANLPYSISTPIITKILHQPITSATIMVQKEIADRCSASAGNREYSRLSVICKLHSNIKKLFSVGPENFIPRPKVQSTVMYLERNDMKLNNPHLELELLTTNLFSLKRRILRSVIRGFIKRKCNEDVWNNVPFGQDRINTLSPVKLDEILSYLKNNRCWPIA